jgi:hypothetical protein
MHIDKSFTALALVGLLTGCTTSRPVSTQDCQGAPAELLQQRGAALSAALAQFQQAGWEVGVTEGGADGARLIVVAPEDFCHGPNRPTFSGRKLRALTANEFATPSCDQPPIVIANACTTHE